MDQEKLRDYANLEGAELGEAVNCLLDLLSYTDQFSGTFNEALEAELQSSLAYFESRCKIVERTEAGMVERTVRKLEWID